MSRGFVKGETIMTKVARIDLGNVQDLSKAKSLLDCSSRLFLKPGSVLLSHCLTAAVSSALEGLTSVFGMGTGVAPPVWPPGTFTLNRSSQPSGCVIVEDHVYQE